MKSQMQGIIWNDLALGTSYYYVDFVGSGV